MSAPVQVERWASGHCRGDNVKVAVLDSGIEAGHAWVGPVHGYVNVRVDSAGVQFDTRPHADAFGHGTACASIIRALAPACELYSVQVLGAALSGTAAALASGLRWAIDNGMQICNLSLGTTRQEFHAELHELAELAYSHNVVLVAALSNLDVLSYPAACESVLAVTARPFADPQQVSYSERPSAAFGARGMDVPVAWLNGGWRTMSGNSYAAPHVTGRIAQILGKDPGLRADEVNSILRELAAQANNPRREVGFSSISP